MNGEPKHTVSELSRNAGLPKWVENTPRATEPPYYSTSCGNGSRQSRAIVNHPLYNPLATEGKAGLEWEEGWQLNRNSRDRKEVSQC
jgi:hypothetical protein